MSEATIPASSALSQMTFRVKVSGVKIAQIRLSLAKFAFKLGAAIAGTKVRIDVKS